MKLQKQMSREISGKKYQKWVVTLPKTLISKLKWGEGTELDADAQGELLILREHRGGQTTVEEVNEGYESFKQKVLEGLRGEDEGLTWGQLREKQGMKQARPFHTWVRQLEKDIGLIRQRRGTQIYWLVPKH